MEILPKNFAGVLFNLCSYLASLLEVLACNENIFGALVPKLKSKGKIRMKKKDKIHLHLSYMEKGTFRPNYGGENNITHRKGKTFLWILKYILQCKN